MPLTDLEPVLSKIVVAPSGCWEWTGWHNGKGYGQLKFHGRRWYSHRLMYRLAVGDIPNGLELDHLCRNTRCCRPDHLEPVTHRENALRGVGPAARRAAATHCESGHPFDEANTYNRKDGKGLRECRRCRANRECARRARRKGTVA